MSCTTIVFGNEKGGSGKTTAAIHLIVGLMKLGFSVASIDLDGYQQSLSCYMSNRKETARKLGINLNCSHHINVPWSADSIAALETQEEMLATLLDDMNHYDFRIIDTPGSHVQISKLAHSYADVVITPLNDSFVDAELIGHTNPENLNMISPGLYSAMLFEQKLRKAARDRKEIDWIVIRNRLPSNPQLNQKNLDIALRKMSQKLGFRIAPGFSDRVVMKELFLHGLTLYDSKIRGFPLRMTPSILAGRQEMRNFMKALRLPQINQKLDVERKDIASHCATATSRRKATL